MKTRLPARSVKKNRMRGFIDALVGFRSPLDIAPADPTQDASPTSTPDAFLLSASSALQLSDPTKCAHHSCDALPVCCTRIGATLCRLLAIARSLACTTSSRWRSS